MGLAAGSGFHLLHPKTISTPHHTCPQSQPAAPGSSLRAVTIRLPQSGYAQHTQLSRPDRRTPPRKKWPPTPLSPAPRPAGHHKMAAATRSPAASSLHVQRPPQPAGREGEAHAQRRGRRGRPARRSRLEPAAVPPPPPPPAAISGQGAGGAEAAAPVRAGVGEGGHKEARAGRVWSRDKGGGERQLLGFKPWCLTSSEERVPALCCSHAALRSWTKGEGWPQRERVVWKQNASSSLRLPSASYPSASSLSLAVSQFFLHQPGKVALPSLPPFVCCQSLSLCFTAALPFSVSFPIVF